MHEPGSYSLIKGKDRQDWSAIGTGVPEAVTQTLNISELSWQSQMDPPFLLSASPGDVARTLNEVADLDKIDSTLVNINRMARDNRAKLTECVQQKQRLEIDLYEFRELDNQLAKVVQLKEMERKAGLLEGMVADGDHLVCSITDQEEALSSYMEVEGHLAYVQQLNKLVIQAGALELDAETGQNWLDEIQELNTRLKRIKDPTDAEAELDLLLDMAGQLKQAETFIIRMEDYVSCIQETTKRLKTAGNESDTLEKQWHEQTKGQCPLCGRGGK